MNARVVLYSRCAACWQGPACAQSKGQLKLPEFAALADKASESVTVTLDSQTAGPRLPAS